MHIKRKVAVYSSGKFDWARKIVAACRIIRRERKSEYPPDLQDTAVQTVL